MTEVGVLVLSSLIHRPLDSRTDLDEHNGRMNEMIDWWKELAYETPPALKPIIIQSLEKILAAVRNIIHETSSAPLNHPSTPDPSYLPPNSPHTSRAASVDTEASSSSTTHLQDVSSKSRKRRADGTSTPRSTKKRKRSSSPATLLPIDHSLSPGPDSTGVLLQARNRFHRELTELQVKLKKDNKWTDKNFSPQEVIDICNFFFVEVIGKPVLGRLSDFHRFYTSHLATEFHRGASVKAEICSQDTTKPPVVRDFFHSMSRAMELNTEFNSMYMAFMRMRWFIDLHERWTTLKELAVAEDDGLRVWLTGLGVKTDVGKGYLSLINAQIAHDLELDPKTKVLQNLLQRGQALATLVEQFSRGIIVLLPANACNKLRNWGNQQMRAVYPLLKECLPELHDICLSFEENIYKPMMSGAALPKTLRLAEEPIVLNQLLRDPIEDHNRITSADTPTPDSELTGTKYPPHEGITQYALTSSDHPLATVSSRSKGARCALFEPV